MMNAKLKNILIGLGLLTAVTTGTVNDVKAQNHNNRKNVKQQTEQVDEEYEEEDPWGINQMTEQEKRLRLEAIPGEIEKLKKLAVEREENYNLLNEYIAREFPFEKYKDENVWKIPAAVYIRDSLNSYIDKKLSEEKDSATIADLENSKEALNAFWGYMSKESFMTMPGVSLGFAQEYLLEFLERAVRDDLVTPEQAKIVSRFLDMFKGNTKQPWASKYDIVISEINNRYIRDGRDLRILYQTGEMSPEEYTKKERQLKKIYNLLYSVAEAANKSKKLNGSNLYNAMRSLVYYAGNSRIREWRFDDLKEEETKLKQSLGIYVPAQNSTNIDESQQTPKRRGGHGM